MNAPFPLMPDKQEPARPISLIIRSLTWTHSASSWSVELKSLAPFDAGSRSMIAYLILRMSRLPANSPRLEQLEPIDGSRGPILKSDWIYTDVRGDTLKAREFVGKAIASVEVTGDRGWNAVLYDVAGRVGDRSENANLGTRARPFHERIEKLLDDVSLDDFHFHTRFNFQLIEITRNRPFPFLAYPSRRRSRRLSRMS